MGTNWNQGLFLKLAEVDTCQKKARGPVVPGVQHLAGLLEEGLAITLGGPGLLEALQKRSHLWHLEHYYMRVNIYLSEQKHYPHFILARCYPFLRCKREAFSWEGLMISKCNSKENCKLKSTPKHFLKPWVIRGWITLFLSARSVTSSPIYCTLPYNPSQTAHLLHKHEESYSSGWVWHDTSFVFWC